MSKKMIISFLVLGIVSIAAQTIILREMTISFYGNEFFIGIVLASWLFWVALGSRIKRSLAPFNLTWIYVLVGVFFFLEIFLIRYLKTWIGFPGEDPNLVYAFFLALILTAPLCFVLGLWWKIGTKAKTVNKAYFLEVLGFIIGGILITLFLFYFPSLGKFDQITASYRFKGQELIESINSPYGNIAITKIGEQYNFYESGLLLGTSEETQFSEDLIHFSLLQHPYPKKVLLIGAGFNGALDEILKHPTEQVYYLELDPKLIETIKKYILLPEVKIINQDGRYFLNQTEEKFDLIIINLPNPSTALLNRFYTQEFFEKLKEKLNPNGILTTYLSYSPSTPSKNLENLNACLYKTLKSVFSKVMILPEETNFFLAGAVSYNSETLIQRFQEREIETEFFNEQYIDYRLSNDRILKAINSFKKSKVEINKDFYPIAYFYQTLFWLEKFYFNFAQLFKKISSSFWLIFIITLTLLSSFFLRRKQKSLAPLFSAGVAGFSLIALEMIIIFSYQIAIGYLYLKIALLISALTAGMALGVYYASKTKKSSAFYFHLMLIIFPIILYFIIIYFANETSLIVSAIIAGFLGGAIFPLANKAYLSQQSEPDKKTGLVYSVDLLGSCLGALIFSLILIPVFGLLPSLLLISITNLWIIFIQRLGQ